jgi:hypothetical protein
MLASALSAFAAASFLSFATCNTSTVSDSLEKKDIVPLDSLRQTMDSCRYTAQEFTYADTRAYTIDGTMPRRTTEWQLVPTIITGGVYTSLVAGLHIYQSQKVWADKASFRILDDFDVDLLADKGGHFLAGYTMSKFSADALMASGVSRNDAMLGGMAMGFGYQLYVEIMDGFGKNWGFSPTDVLFNGIGAGLFIAQHYAPVLQNFTPKATFFPAPWFGEKKRFYATDIWVDDYSAWTWWVSVNVHNLLPKTIQPYYPSWLNIAVGYTARNLDWDDATRRIIISLDYDLTKILPEGGAFWNWIRQYVNLIKLPAPAIEFTLSPSWGYVRPPRFYLLFPFKIGATP